MFCIVLKNSSENFSSEIHRHNLNIYECDAGGKKRRVKEKGRERAWERGSGGGRERISFFKKRKFLIKWCKIYKIKLQTLKCCKNKMRFTTVLCQWGLHLCFCDCYRAFASQETEYIEYDEWQLVSLRSGCKTYWKAVCT